MTANNLTYNGYTFGAHSHVEVSIEMIYDDSQRVVTYHKHTIDVTAIVIAESGDTDAGEHFERIRRTLSKPGQHLTLESKGFGPSLDVNKVGSTEKTDATFGPMPRIVTWKPVGHTGSVEMTWQCVFTIPDCSNAAYTGLAALNYSIGFDINDKGFTTRTVSGYLEIALTRKLSAVEGASVGGKEIEDTADAYRDVVIVPKPINFKRRQSWNVSADKRRADFTIIDAEIESPNAWPIGVTNIDASHDVRASGRSRATINNMITATIELAQGQPRVLAWEIFRAIVNRRVRRSVEAGMTVMFEDMQISEGLFSNTLRFAFSYRVIGEELHKILGTLGLFESLGYDWQRWSNSMNAVEDNRGLAQLEHTAAEDQLHSLCESASPRLVANGSVVTFPYPSSFPTMCNTKPDADKSYVHYEATLIEETTSNTAVTHTLGSVDVENVTFDPSDPLATIGDVTASSVTSTLSQSMPGQRWRWKGYMERLGYPIPTPDILTVDGVTLKRTGKGKVGRKLKGNYFCQPLYAAAFNILYEVIERPSEADGGLDDPTENPPA